LRDQRGWDEPAAFMDRLVEDGLCSWAARSAPTCAAGLESLEPWEIPLGESPMPSG